MLFRSEDNGGQVQQALYDYSQGITDIAVKLFLLTQIRVIESAKKPEEEFLDAAAIKMTAERDLGFTQPLIEALRNGRDEEIVRYGDLGSIEILIDDSGHISTKPRLRQELLLHQTIAPLSSSPKSKLLHQDTPVKIGRQTKRLEHNDSLTPMLAALKFAAEKNLDRYSVLKQQGFLRSPLNYSFGVDKNDGPLL